MSLGMARYDFEEGALEPEPKMPSQKLPARLRMMASTPDVQLKGVRVGLEAKPPM